MKMTARFADAFAFANALHDDQTRKGNAIPYISHLMSVSALVLESGGDEDQAIAGLLHDAVEDQGGLTTARLIAERFGERVAGIVLACTDATPEPGEAKAPWRDRKTAYIGHLADVQDEALVVIASDKTHNLQSIINDVQRDGLSTLERFDSPTQIAWYYRSVADELARRSLAEPIPRLLGLVDQFEALVEEGR
jgi:(p)ppGpp synthase/HD superfamily hydrolase